MVETTNLGLELIDEAQTEKHVTANENFWRIDALAQLTVISAALTTPPVAPTEGDRYIVAAGAVDDWDDEDGKVALWADAQWYFFTPKDGWTAYNQATGTRLAYTTGGGWAASFSAGLSGLFGAGSAAAPSIAFAADTDTGLYSSSGNVLGFAAGGAAKATLSSTVLSVLIALTLTGLLTVNAGIAFPATQVAVADANTLDDYEEGTTTPTLSFATAGNSSFSYVTQICHYTKIGNHVLCAWQFTFTPTIGTGSGNFQIALPFTAVTSINFSGSVGSLGSNFTWTASRTGVSVFCSSASVANIGQHGSGVASTVMSNSNLTSGSQHTISAALSYHT